MPHDNPLSARRGKISNHYVPHAGSIYDKLPVILQMVRAALATTGCRTIDALHAHAVLEQQSPVALQDSQIHGMVPVHGVS